MSKVILILIILHCANSCQSYLQIGDFCPTADGPAIRKTLLEGREFENGTMVTCNPFVPLECITGRCQCKRGYTINRNGTKCLEIARNGLESLCEESIQCWKGLLGRLSECNMVTGKCQCYESETLPIVFHQGRCYYGESLGDYCQIEGLCTATTENSTCKTGVCQCKDGYVPSWDKSRCLQIASESLDSPCEENIQCEKSLLGTLSECSQETMRCQCYQIPMVATLFYSGRCYFGASLGDVCQVTAQCLSTTENSLCGQDGKCKCDESSGFVANSIGSACLAIVSSDDGSVDEECVEDIQCTRTLGHFSRCNLVRKKCECFSPEEGGQTDGLAGGGGGELPMVIVGAKCYASKLLGEQCKYKQQCAVVTPHSDCINETCQCDPEKYVSSFDAKKCLEVGTDGLGSPCDEDVQCTQSILGPLSRCDPIIKNCTCSSILPVVYYDKACFFHRQLGTPCESDSECRAGGNPLAECLSGRCTCGLGSKVEGQTCVIVTSELKSTGASAHYMLYEAIFTFLCALAPVL